MENKINISDYMKTFEQMKAESKQQCILLKNEKHKNNLSITEIVKNYPMLYTKFLIQSSTAKKTYFTPWFYNKYKKQWIGLQRWYGNNNKDIKICTRKDYKRYHFVKMTKSLPVNHPYRTKLQHLKYKYICYCHKH